MYCEEWQTAPEAIAREEVPKGWRRDRKLAQDALNPGWADLNWDR
jgi:predicted GIY-YIG superfamily endonuclease